MRNWRTRSRPDLGARLVAELGLDLIPDLRELLVAAKLLAGDVGHDLLVGHGEAELGALAILAGGTCCRPCRTSGRSPPRSPSG